MFKKIVLVVGLLLIATNLWAAKDVSVTRHNLSSTATALTPVNYYISTNEDEVCIFCHTPHGGTLNTPLWNRAVPTGIGFTHYSSTTLAPTLLGPAAAARVVWPESLLCMSCHDGSLAMSTLSNVSNRTGGVPLIDATPLGKMQTMFENPGSVIGDRHDPVNTWKTLGVANDLSDDHPISFSYSAVLGDPGFASKLKSVLLAKGAGIRFFGATDRVECSSCHDPHANYEAAYGGDASLSPFLVMNNNGSALCLACHIK